MAGTWHDRTNEFVALVEQSSGHPAPVPTGVLARNLNVYRALNSTRDQLSAEQALRVTLAECQQAADEAANDQERLHWCEAKRVAEHWFGKQTQAKLPVNRSSASSQLERRLQDISSLYSTVNELLSQQARPIGDIEQNIAAIEARVDATGDQLMDAAPRVYRTRRWRWYWRYWPHTLSAQLRCLLALVLAVNTLIALQLAGSDGLTL